jgi:hypothetical protein
MTVNRHTQLLQSSVPLCRINKQSLPNRHASGCLIDYHGHRVLLTVEHAVGKGKQWAIQVRYDPTAAATQLWRFGNTLNFLKKQSLTTGQSTTIDFAYAEVPSDLQIWRQDISDQGKIRNKWPITAFPINFDTPLA